MSACTTLEETTRLAILRMNECWLHEEPTPFDSAEALETFLATVVLRCHVDAMTAAAARAFLHEVVARLPSLKLDYVRLNIRARRRTS